MKRLILFIFILYPLLSYGVNEDTSIKKIESAQTNSEKEDAYIDWVRELSQTNTLYCDSIIKQRDSFVPELSDDGKLTLLILFLGNSKSGGSVALPVIDAYNLKESDAMLVRGLVKCFTYQSLSKKEFQLLTDNLNLYEDPTRLSMYYVISTCIVGISNEDKITAYLTSLKHAKRSSIKTIFSSILNELSLFYIEIEDFEQAIYHQQRAIAYSKKHNLKANLINHLLSIGKIQYKLEDYKKTEDALFEALKISHGLSLDYAVGQIYNQLGELNCVNNNLSASIRFYQQSLLRFYAIKNIEGLASAHKNMGNVYFKNNDISLAEKNFLLSEEFSNQLGERSLVGELYLYMAELYLSKDQLKLAEENLLKSIEYWKRNELLIPLNNAYFLYAKIKNKQGDVRNAYAYLEQYILFRDSVSNLETKKKVAELSEMFKSEQKERIIAEQERELEEELSHRLLVQNKLENSKQQNRLIVIILIVSLILFGAIFIIIRNRNKQEQLIKKQREIELQQTLLRTQMNPHFIFNAMSVIQSYIYDEDVVNSSKFLIHFSKLMRMILENNAKEFVTLEIELEIINRYLILQKMRFEDRFDFKILNDDFSDPTTISIPPMLVQPFIENAIEHGDLDKVEGGLIKVNCQIVEDLFIFTVEDNGIGRKAALKKKKLESSGNHRSMAIELTQDRILLLNEKYKSKGYLRIEDLDSIKGTGTKTTIAIPFITNY